MNHVRALDGVRGLAIVAVLLFHYTWVSCGWAGVQLFFVLSGFLITSILVSETDLPVKFYLQRFYWRRSLRIFPLYYAFVLVVTAVYFIYREPATFGRYSLAIYTYTFNFEKMRPDYGTLSFFGHFWSLAVEEQFYLVWPLAIYLLSPRSRKYLVITLLAVCPVIRAMTALLLSRISDNPFYLGQAVGSNTLGQLDAFAAGAFLVLFKDKLPAHPGRWFVASSVLVLAAGQLAAFLIKGRFATDTSLGYSFNMFAGGQHIWGYTLINFWSASLIFLALHRNWFSNLLSRSMPTFLGRISYGMYIFHMLIQGTLLKLFGYQHGLANLAMFLTYFALLLGISVISHLYFESIFLKLKDSRFTRRAGQKTSELSTAAVAR
jgi:peptidoglycan/LPS O-acetylase OafA/YrhL